jgi:hypothetical protein
MAHKEYGGNAPGAGRGNKTGRRSASINGQNRARLDIVEQMLRQGYTSSSIQLLLSKKWDITRRQVRNYLNRVYKEWEAEHTVTTQSRVQQRRAQLEGVLELALRQDPPHLRAAIQALDRLCRIDGCYPKDQVQIVQPSRIALGMGLGAMGFTSAEDVRARLTELKTRLLKGGPISAGYLEASSYEDEDEDEEKAPTNGKGNGTNPIN